MKIIMSKKLQYEYDVESVIVVGLYLVTIMKRR